MIPRSLMEKNVILNSDVKPLELYVFIDPNCSKCWYIQPILRKLQIDYERYFTFRVVLKTSLPTLNLPYHQQQLGNNTNRRDSHPAFPSIAIKAAEFQGKRAGFKYLSKLFEYAYIKNRDVNTYAILIEIAQMIKLDIEEFAKDFSSKHVQRSLQVDLYMAKEMEVEQAPTFVFFNENIEDAGLKVSGFYTYDIYEQIIKELIGHSILPDPPPPLNHLFKRFDTLATKEIAEIYRVSEKSAERELKKRLLQQEIERFTTPEVTLWRKKS